jgi:hypothetical protein
MGGILETGTLVLTGLGSLPALPLGSQECEVCVPSIPDTNLKDNIVLKPSDHAPLHFIYTPHFLY